MLTIIQGGQKKLTTGFLEAISEQIMRARTCDLHMEVGINILQGLLQEVIQRRREEAADQEEIDGILAEMESADEFILKVSESRIVPFDFSNLEIKDLEQLCGSSSHSEITDITEEDLEPEEGEEEMTVNMTLHPLPIQLLSSRQRRDYWVSSLRIKHVLLASLLGFLALAMLILLTT